MESTRLIVVRHGETVWNVEGRYQGHLDSPLTATGLAQSGALAARLAKYTFSALHSSDLGRALHTAQIISKRTGHTRVADARLRERDLGIFQGLTKDEIRQRFPEEYRRFRSGDAEYVLSGGESAAQAGERMIGGLEDLAGRHPGEQIVVVAHGGVLSALLRYTLGLAAAAPRRFERRNATWNVFTWKDAKWFLETWGDAAHLDLAS